MELIHNQYTSVIPHFSDHPDLEKNFWKIQDTDLNIFTFCYFCSQRVWDVDFNHTYSYPQGIQFPEQG